MLIPAGVDDLTVRKRLLNEFGIEIGGGLGDFKGKVWRIGLMGLQQPAGGGVQRAGGARTVLARRRGKGYAWGGRRGRGGGVYKYLRAYSWL